MTTTSRRYRIICSGASLQLNSGAARIQARQRNRQTSLEITSAEQRLCRFFLKTRHVAIRDNVRLQFWKAHEDVWISEANTNQARVPRNQFSQGPGSWIRQCDAAR